MKRLVFAAAICAAAGFCVYAEGLVPTQLAPWYDAGIRGYSAGDLPETVAEVGSWSKDEGVTATVVKPEEADAVIDLKAPTGKLAFTPATAPTTSAAAIETDVSFYAYEFDDMPSADNGSRTGFTAAQKQDGSYAFFGKSNGAWVEISNAAVTAAEHLSIKLRIELDTSATPAKARYLVNGNAMADANGATWLPVAETATAVGAAPVEYAGVGQVASLTADTVDKTRAIAWCKRNGDGVVTDIEYFATFADAKARIGDMGPADTMVVMQDLEIPLTPGETLSIDLTKFLNPENYTLTPTGVDGYKIVDGTEGTTYTLEVYPIKGFGTAEAPFEIGTVAELKAFRDGVNVGKLGLAGEIYRQTADIDLKGETWVGIGDGANDAYPFKGVYDGGNHAVSNFAVSKDASYGGFFWEVRDATVQNLKLLNVTAEDGAQSVCGVGGMVYGSCTFKNVTLDGEIVGRYNVGGFSAYTGLNEGEQITFEACTNLAKIVNLWHCKVGAFGVYNGSNGNGSMLFKDCLNAGAVTLHHTQSAKSNNALASAGGYFGWFNKSDSAAFENCVNSGNVTVVYDDETYKGSGCSAGGFIGSVHSEPTNVSFANCVNTGKIVVSNFVDTANANAGGFIGACTRPMSFENCQSLGELEAVNTLSETAVCTATFVAANGGTAPTVAGEMTALAAYKPLGGSVASPALSFATVAEGVATFVAADSLVAGGDYKVMLPVAAATVACAAIGDTVTIDPTFAAAGFAVADQSGRALTAGANNVYTLGFNNEIWDKRDLDYVAAQVAAGNAFAGVTLVQKADIDLKGASVKIGDDAGGKAFSGTYDGGNFAISNLKLGAIDSSHWTGLFGLVDGATVRNLTLAGVTTENTTEKPFYRGGAIAGKAKGAVSLSNVTVSGSLEGHHNIGGLVGIYDDASTLTFTGCTNHATIATADAGTKLGGILCYANKAGGSVAFTDCLNTGDLTVPGAAATEGARLAGITAGCWANIPMNFTRCKNTGAISGTQFVCKNQANWQVWVAGIAGQLNNAVTFEDCENTGAIYGNSGNVGGESGSVSADARVGSVAGICGQSAGKVTLAGEIRSLGTVTSVIRENPDRVKVGSLVGIAANGVEVAEDAVVTTSVVTLPALGSGSCAALDFATVENGIATFVTVLAKDTQYKVMQAGGTAAFELEAENDYISFDHALAGATYAITSKTGAVGTNDVDNVITFTALASVPTVVKPGEPIICNTVEEALNVKAKATFAPSDEVAKMFGENADAKAAYCAKFGFDLVPTSDGKWAVVAALKPEAWSNLVESAQAATRQIDVAGIAALELGVATNVTVEGCVPGFYYTIYGGSTATNLKAFVSADKRNVLCVPGKPVTFPDVVKPTDAAGFFSIGVKETGDVVSADTLNLALALGLVLADTSNPICKLTEFNVTGNRVSGRIATICEDEESQPGDLAKVVLWGTRELGKPFVRICVVLVDEDGSFAQTVEGQYRFFKVSIEPNEILR